MIFKNIKGFGNSEDAFQQNIPIALLYDHYGELYAIRVLKFIAQKTRINTYTITSRVVDDVALAAAQQLFFYTYNAGSNTVGMLNPVTMLDYDNNALGTNIYQLLPYGTSKSTTMTLVSPSGVIKSVTNKKALLRILRDSGLAEKNLSYVPLHRIAIYSRNHVPADRQSSNIAYPIYLSELTDNSYRERMLNVAADMMHSGIISTDKVLPRIYALPKSPYVIFPEYIPILNINSMDSCCPCTQIKFPDEVYTPIVLRLKHSISKLILPKRSKYGIAVDTMGVASLANIEFPDRCKEFVLMNEESSEIKELTLPIVNTDKYTFYSNFYMREIIAHVTNTLAIATHPQGNLKVVSGNTYIYRVFSKKPVCLQFDLKDIHAQRKLFFYLDYVESLVLTLSTLVDAIVIEYLSIQELSIDSGSAPNTKRILFICKSGGTPITKRKQREFRNSLRLGDLSTMEFIDEP